MSFFNKLISTATANFRPPPSPSSNPEAGEGSFLFDDGAASHIVVDPPSEVLGQALAEIQQIGEGSVPRKLELLSDIHRSLTTDGRTKDLFREGGGFLALVSVLSGLRPAQDLESDVGESAVLVDTELAEVQRVECLRLVLWSLCEAMADHAVNRIHFEEQITFSALSSAIELSSLLLPPMSDHTFSLLLCFSHQDFTLSDVFPGIRRALTSLPGGCKAGLDPEVYEPVVDQHVEALAPRLGNLYFSQPLLLLLEAQELLLPDIEPALAYAIVRVLEAIAQTSQRSNILLSQMAFVSILIPRVFRFGYPADPQRPALLRLLRRVVEAGVKHSEARALFQLAMRDDTKLDDEVLEVIRRGMKSRWPSFISCWGRSWIECRGLTSKGFNKEAKGFAYMAWVHVSTVDSVTSLPLLEIADAEDRALLSLLVNSNGDISLEAAGVQRTAVESVRLPLSRWVLVGLVGKKAKAGFGDMTVLIDGKRAGVTRFPYPQVPDQITSKLVVRLGSSTVSTSSAKNFHRWNLGPSYLFADPLPDDLFFLAHHLGPRYSGNFQVVLGSFLTYEASTSLNIFLSTIARESGGRATDAGSSRLVQALKDGRAVDESTLVLAFSAENARVVDPGLPVENGAEIETVVLNGAIPKLQTAKTFTRGLGLLCGEAIIVPGRSMDEEIWALGGCAPLLKLIELAKTPVQLTSTVAICVEALKESWRNSEDMERSHGYEIFARLLEPKMADLMTIDALRVLLGSLGVTLEKPETSTISNATGYRYLILAFELWSRAPKELQLVHLSHFRDLVKTSKFRRFNIRQRLFKKMALTRKLLFALRAGYYEEDVVPTIIETLSVVSDQFFSTEDTIKPIVAYLVSCLCPSTSSATPSDKPEHGALVLDMLARLIHNPAHLSKLQTNLPLHRVILLLLANNPSPPVLLSCLDMISYLIASSHGETFGRKFDTEGGFSFLCKILPPVWDTYIHALAFSILLGRPVGVPVEDGTSKTVVCSLILPAILAAIEHGLRTASEMATGQGPSSRVSDASESDDSLQMGSDFSGIGQSSTSSAPPASNWTNTTNLIREITGLLTSSSSFTKLVRTRKIVPEQLVRTSSTFMTKTELNVDDDNFYLFTLRDAVQQLLRALLRCRIPTALQTEIQKVLPTEANSYFSPLSSSLSSSFPNSPGPVATLQRRISLQRKNTVDSFESLAESMSTKQGIDKRVELTRRPSEEFHFQSSKDRNTAWRQIILSVEASRFTRAQRELRLHQKRVDEKDWPLLRARLEQERGLYPSHDPEPEWRLDGSEGPLRQRLRLERAVRDAHDGSSSFYPKRDLRVDRTIDQGDLEDIISPVTATKPSAPWEDPFTLGSLEGKDEPEETPAEQEVVSHRERLQQTLVSGDMIEEILNTVRIVGVDALPGLLVSGRTHLYLLDGLTKSNSGDISEADGSERDVFSIPGTIAHVDSEEKSSHQWRYEDIVENSKRNFLFRDVGLELYFKDSINFLLVFPTKKIRDAIHAKLAAKIDGRDAVAQKSAALGGFLMSRVGNKLATVISGKLPELEDATARWANRQISNFAYLVIINQIAGRTPNDVTQFPVFPWVLADYTSEELDMKNNKTYRNLSLPMGALTPARREAAIDRYTHTQQAGETPFHYGTHFSSSMIVASFLIRQSPFTEMFKVLQGGNFDLADRLFSSIPRAWESASKENRGDVRELIPSFYYGYGDFLRNINNHDFGRKQGGGQVDDVELPKWARDDPLLFITKHREALESNYVSVHLSAWIDLIFGVAQRDPNRVNCFHPLSYSGAIDLDKIADPNEKAATVGIIHNFGQTPPRLFDMPHPRRLLLGGKPGLPVGVRFGVAENYQILIQSAAPINSIKNPVASLITHYSRLRPWPDQRLPIPGRNIIVEWGFAGGGLRIYTEDHRLCSMVEWASIATAAFADEKTFITGSFEGVVSFWKVGSEGRPTMELFQSMTGHGDTIASIVVSKAWSVLVTGSKDGVVILWDLNRVKYIRTIFNETDASIHLLAVNESNGIIALCHTSTVELYTLNGTFICSTLTAHPSDPILAVAFFDTREWCAIQMIATGHSKGKIVLWQLVADGTPVGERAIWKLVPLRTIHLRDGNKADITSIRFLGESLYVGDSRGHVHLFALPDGGAENVPDSTPACMNGKHTTFGLLEQRRWCGGCGGCFCGSCVQHVPRFTMRFCDKCRIALALGMIGEVDHEIDTESLLPDEPGSRRSSLTINFAPLSRRTSIVSLEPGNQSIRRETLLGCRSPSPSPFAPSPNDLASTTPTGREPGQSPSPHYIRSRSPPRKGPDRSRSRSRSPHDPFEALRGRSSRGASPAPSPLGSSRNTPFGSTDKLHLLVTEEGTAP